MIAIQWGCWFLVDLAWCLVLMSLIEYWGHRWKLHGLTRGGLWSDHRHYRHHRYHEREFCHYSSADPDLRLRWWDCIVLSCCLLAAFSLVSPLASWTMFGVLVLHHVAWNTIHSEMHDPQYPWWARSSYYRAVARHHYLHHRHPESNFNMVLPLWDFLLRTSCYPTPNDSRVMQALGYYSDEHASNPT